MEKRKLKFPIGIENFEKLRTEGFYYIDKTAMIKELLENWGGSRFNWCRAPYFQGFFVGKKGI